jgi:uncharacterized protein YgiM (DUF1202 family)
MRQLSVLGFGLGLLLTACGASTGRSEVPALVAQATWTLTPTVTQTLTSTPTPTPTPTTTPSPSPTLSVTATPTVSPTLPATETPTGTNTQPPTPEQITVSSGVGAYVRSGPGVAYDVAGIVQPGAVYDALAYAVDADGDVWYLIMLESGAEAWISEWVSVLRENVNLARIAIAATVPPLPSATPSLTRTPTLPPTVTLTFLPQPTARTSEEYGVNLRSGAGTEYARLETLPPDTPLQLVGRTADMTWVQVTTPGGRQGWIMAELLNLGATDLSGLAVSWLEPTEATPVASVNDPFRVVLSATIMQQARQIYRHGQQLGNRPSALLLIGDSVNIEGNFLHSFANGNYDLGEYAYLQPTVDFFRASGTLDAPFLTEHAGFKYDMILDPTWADPRICEPGETPLDCEIRTKKPSFAIIHLAMNDMLFYSLDDYQVLMNQVLQSLIGYGVIPVLTTSTGADDFRPEQMPIYNQVIRETAASFNIPLIDFREAARSLPNHGTGEDGAHLSYPESWHIAFTGDQYIYGVTLRELLTWLMLDELRRNVIDASAIMGPIITAPAPDAQE